MASTVLLVVIVADMDTTVLKGPSVVVAVEDDCMMVTVFGGDMVLDPVAVGARLNVCVVVVVTTTSIEIVFVAAVDA